MSVDNLLRLARLVNMGCMCGRESVDVSSRRFYVKTRLGEGGFSYVDLVEDRHAHKLFALKRLTCHSTDDERIAQQEADYMNILHHPNLVPCEAHQVVPLYGGGPNQRGAMSEFLIVMPYYRKGSVQDELEFLGKHGAHMKEERILTLLQGICEGIKALHALTPTALTHRDIKPHNVMLEADDTPVLMDFGSMGPAQVEIKGSSEARAMQDFAAERCSMPYRAPELFQVESYCTIDDKIDIWSLGCTLYAMCFRESPFDKVYQRGDSIALAAMAGNVKIPSTPAYSAGATDLISTMLAVSPTERPNIDWVLQRVNNLLSLQDNRV